MSMLSQGAEGLAVAVSCAAFLATRTPSAAAFCALQGAIVSVLVALHFGWLAIIPLALVAAILPVSSFFSARADRARPASLLVGGALVLLALTFPGKNLALPVVVLGAALTVTRRSAAMQMFGLILLQNGIVLAATNSPVAGVGTAMAMLPIIPALACAGLWLTTTRQGVSVLAAWPTNTWFDAIACSAVLPFACVLAVLIPMTWAAVRVDAFVATLIPLLAIVATAASWAPRLRTVGTGPAGARFVLVLSAALAVLVDDPVQSWLALVIATTAAASSSLPRRAEAWRRLRLGSLGLGIALSGTMASAGVNVWAPVCIIVGLGTVACLAPELALASLAIIVRQLHPLAGHAPVHALLMVAGLAGIAVTGGAALLGRKRVPPIPFTGPGQAGVALFAFGLGIPAANIAALVSLVLLSLTQSGLLLAGEGSLAQLVATAGLAGVPPFGIFPGLALVIAATAARLPWMLLPFAAALGLLVWSTLAQLSVLPAARSLSRTPYAWAPLLLALLVGFAMPQPVFAWLQSAAAGAL